MKETELTVDDDGPPRRNSAALLQTEGGQKGVLTNALNANISCGQRTAREKKKELTETNKQTRCIFRADFFLSWPLNTQVHINLLYVQHMVKD